VNIVVLDGYTLNPGDLNWEGLEALGNLTVYDRPEPGSFVEVSRRVEILFTNKTLLGKKEFRNLPNLKYLGVLATGYNVVDTKAARESGVIVTNTPSYGTDSVAQHAFALLLELCNHVQRHSDSVLNGKWAGSKDFCFWDYPLVELSGKTIGIIGFGNIGQKVCDIATAFGMNVLAFDAVPSKQDHRRNFAWVDIPDLFKNADVVSIHCPLTDETSGLVNQKNLSRMKSSAFLINTSRGPIIKEEDLADALNNGIIAGAGLDVLSIEPPHIANPLFKARNCLITPHIAWATKEARSRLMDIAINNLKAYLDGTPVNIVNS
jgi:glycerate dehydrogenase